MPIGEKTQKRLPFIDLMKGICIILIVVGHVDAGLFEVVGGNADHLFETFRVPMYYFISGIFFKTYGGFLDFTRKKVNNIVVPFAFFYSLAYLAQLAFAFSPFPWRPFGPFRWGYILQPLLQRYWNCNAPLWFLMSLFQVNILYYVLRRLFSRGWMLLAAVVALSVVGYWLTVGHVRMLYYAETALTGLPFFALGAALKRHGALETSRRDRWGLLVLPLVLLLLGFTAREIDIYSQVLPPYLLFYGLSSLAIVALFWCCKNFGRIPGVNYLGRYSLIVLGTHYVCIPLVSQLARRVSGLDGLALSALVLALVLALMFPTVALLRRAVPRLTAQAEFFAPGWRLWFCGQSANDGKKGAAC